MPFRQPILDALLCIARMELQPDQTPRFQFNREVQRLLRYYVEAMAPDTPARIKNYVLEDRKKKKKHAEGKGQDHKPKRRRRRRGGRRRRKSNTARGGESR
jgi:hypothetical protein